MHASAELGEALVAESHIKQLKRTHHSAISDRHRYYSEAADENIGRGRCSMHNLAYVTRSVSHIIFFYSPAGTLKEMFFKIALKPPVAP